MASSSACCRCSTPSQTLTAARGATSCCSALWPRRHLPSQERRQQTARLPGSWSRCLSWPSRARWRCSSFRGPAETRDPGPLRKPHKPRRRPQLPQRRQCTGGREPQPLRRWPPLCPLLPLSPPHWRRPPLKGSRVGSVGGVWWCSLRQRPCACTRASMLTQEGRRCAMRAEIASFELFWRHQLRCNPFYGLLCRQFLCVCSPRNLKCIKLRSKIPVSLCL
mmetsp:Transcript_316/g.695  ORF Transcript_316/g.695 Transcript_316/m.695 type:complete len:221 (+) Transcript_316:247-909(+)